MVGGERQVRRQLKFVTENTSGTERRSCPSAGVRFFGERLSADLAVGCAVGAGELYVFPDRELRLSCSERGGLTQRLTEFTRRPLATESCHSAALCFF